jgi:hypothetical protein
MPSEQSAPESGRNPPAKRRHAAPVAPPARAALPSNRQGSTSADIDAPSPSAATNGRQWARVGPVCAAQPRGRGEGRGTEPTWAAAAPSRIQRPAHQPSLHCQWHVLSLRREYAGQPNARPRLRRSQSSATVPRTRHAIRPAAPWRLLGSDAASGTAVQQRAAGCSVCRPQRDRSQVALGCNPGGTRLQHSACGCNTVRVVCRGVELVPVQMWAGMSPVRW